MAKTTALDRSVWQPYFDKVSKNLEGRRVDIEVASLKLGIQVAAKWLPLLGISYDKVDDLIAVMADSLNHMIRLPREVFVQTEGTLLLSIEVIDQDDVQQIIKLREPLMLALE